MATFQVGRIGALACVCGLVVYALPAVAADCPVSAFVLYGVPYPATVAARDTTVKNAGQLMTGGYDLRVGSLSATGMNATMETNTQDDFELVGISPGTVVELHVMLHASGQGSGFNPDHLGSGYAYASLSDGIVLDQASVANGSFDRVLEISSRVIAGQPFRLSCRAVGSGSDGAGQAGGSLEVAGIPTGASVVSCQGFVASQPVRTRPSTGGH